MLCREHSCHHRDHRNPSTQRVLRRNALRREYAKLCNPLAYSRIRRRPAGLLGLLYRYHGVAVRDAFAVFGHWTYGIVAWVSFDATLSTPAAPTLFTK
jgi:hypothetical protein